MAFTSSGNDPGGAFMLNPTSTPTPTATASPTSTPSPEPAVLYVPLSLSSSLVEYPAGSNGEVTPIATITGSNTGLGTGNDGLAQPVGVGLDVKGNIYVSGNIFDSSAPDPAYGRGSIIEYGAGECRSGTCNIKPVATITGNKTGLSPALPTLSLRVSAPALDTAGNIYITIDDTGSLYSGSVLEYAAGSNGNVPPIAEIIGTNSQIGGPTSVVLDDKGNIYVANIGSITGVPVSILKFAPGSNGNVAPIAAITVPTSGDKTQLTAPQAMALDAHANIYVANYNGAPGQQNSILEFAAGSAGNVAPIAVISGGATGMSSSIPEGIVLDTSGNIYVALQKSIAEFAKGITGNVAPINMIDTGFGGPLQLTIGP